jgi:hypothetical protein
MQESEEEFRVTAKDIDLFNKIIGSFEEQPLEIDYFSVRKDGSVSLMFKSLSLSKLEGCYDD